MNREIKSCGQETDVIYHLGSEELFEHWEQVTNLTQINFGAG